MSRFRDIASQARDLLGVFLTFPDVVFSHDFVLVQRIVTLPVEEIHFLQQLLFMEL